MLPLEQTDESPSAPYGRVPDSSRRVLVVILFSLCTILLFADQNLMSPNLSAIAEEFGFDDTEKDKKLGGQIALAFFVLGAPASFIVGCLADSWNRTQLFAVTVCIGEGACLATYWARTYGELYACRAITGFSVGGALPLIYSILGDLFSAGDRHVVSALVGFGTGAGISFGQGVAGFVGPHYGWRLPFLIISVPAIVVAISVWLFVPDPERGAMEEAHRNRAPGPRRDISVSNTDVEMIPLDSQFDSTTNEQTCFDVRTHWLAFKSLLSTPTVLFALLQGAPGCVPWGVVNAYLNDYLAKDRGMTVEKATLTILIFGVGNFLGLVLGGAGSWYLYRMDKRYPALLAGVSAAAGCFPFWYLINGIDDSSDAFVVGLVSLVAGIGAGVTGPIIKAELQNVTMPQERGQAFALFNTTDDFGRGLGPVFVASLISRIGRRKAFNVGVSGWLICGLLNGCIFLTIREDEDRVQNRLASQLGNAKEQTTTFLLESGGKTASTDNTLHRRSITPTNIV